MKCIECSFESDDLKKFRHKGNFPGWCRKCADRQKAADYRLRKFGKKEPRQKFTDEEKRLRAKKSYLDNREKNREREKLYRENNREKINKQQAVYREANREKCKERCLSHYYRNKDKYRKYQQENKEKVREYGKRYRERHSERSKENRRAAQKRYEKNNSEKIRAHKQLNYHVSAGNVTKPETCRMCDQNCFLEGHHVDYSQPLNVIWICKSCHVLADKTRRSDEQKQR